MQKAKKPVTVAGAEQQLLRLSIQLDELHPRIDALEADLKVVTASFTELLGKLTQSVNDKTKNLENTLTERVKKLDERIEFWGTRMRELHRVCENWTSFGRCPRR